MKRATLSDAALLGLTLLLTGATVPLTLAMAGPAAAGRPALVVVPPWGAGAAEVIAAGGGYEIGPRVAPIARFAVLDRPAAARAAGAWAVLDAGALPILCGFERDIR
ncbi:hypothetical protein [Rhodovulum euryhalinum]|uniref:Uncharacterized protein n=1 Tax=Rhodovulum euryhalinum TaxID=35805 RepID=A0A4R2KQF2_9RHOB|nr:hypothetical protein [Rhodovulum euryhalinum]TCO72358.1 hypothetical protein EV655_10444 [Rhodovulum euryhalinum]